AEVGTRPGPPTGPRLGAVRARRRHVPRHAAQRGRRPWRLGLRGDAPREGRESPAGPGPRGRPPVSRRGAPDRRPIPCAGGPPVNLPDRTVLENGAILVSVALPSNPVIAFRGTVPAGVAAEGSEFGLAEFASRLLVSGARRVVCANLADRLGGIGGTREFRHGEGVVSF